MVGVVCARSPGTSNQARRNLLNLPRCSLSLQITSGMVAQRPKLIAHSNWTERFPLGTICHWILGSLNPNDNGAVPRTFSAPLRSIPFRLVRMLNIPRPAGHPARVHLLQEPLEGISQDNLHKAPCICSRIGRLHGTRLPGRLAFGSPTLLIAFASSWRHELSS